MPEDFESKRTVTREEAAATLREMADGIAAGSLLVGEADEPITVDVPTETDLEIEFETDGGDRSFEVELEWSDEETTVETPDSDDIEEPPGETEAVPVSPTQPPWSLARFELFRDKSEEWRWRLVHRNGNVIATSGEGYTRKHNAEKGLRSVVQNAPNAEVTEETDR